MITIQSLWEERISRLQALVMKSMLYNDLCITLIDALPAPHSNDWVLAEHRHPWFEFNYLSEGSLYTTLEGCEFLASAGSFFLIPPGCFHSHRYCSSSGDNGFCLRWQLEKAPLPKDFSNLTASAENIIKVISVPRPTATFKNMEGLISDFNDAHGIDTLQTSFISWLIMLYEQWREKGLEKDNSESRDNALVRQAILYLSEYYAHPIKVQELANSINMSYRHLARIFKQATGLTIIEKLNDIRVNHAKDLLKHTNEAVREIALQVGFENEFYFSNIFNHYTYMTPTNFRKKFKE